MAKIFETSQDIVDLAYDKFNETGLIHMGINLKIMSVTSSKDVLKVSRANATTEFLTKSEDIVTLYVYEDVFDRLTDEQKSILMEGALSNVSYDSEKEKLNVSTDKVWELITMRRKYPNYPDIVEACYLIVEQIKEEEKARKEEEKARKAEEKAMRRRNNM